uniref:NADH-ubiquinone oxidoreductase chain 2 n=1 Tax=Opistholeptus burmanus TaxID=2813440 RepID=A0A8T9ZWE4_9HEMI|nr:NADH dehydrogenase subunit 2 [Opistholeptus burmanus]
MNFSIILYSLMMIMSTLLVLSSKNWFSMWMGLEINLMSFIPLLSMMKNNKSSQAMVIYFLIQSISSVLLLFSIIMSKLFIEKTMIEIINLLMIISLMLKMGVAPLHFWLPEMMSKMGWKKCMILVTWQKLAPLFILSKMNNNLIYISIILSAIAGSIGGLNQTSLRKIMAYSSINHTGWMMAYMMVSPHWYKYWIFYTMMILMLFYYFHMFNMYFINQILIINLNVMEKYILMLMMLSLGGMPPFLGFIPKLMVLMNLFNLKLMFIMLTLLMFSLITLFYYMRIISSILLLNYSTIKWNKTLYLNKNILISVLSINLFTPLMYFIF